VLVLVGPLHVSDACKRPEKEELLPPNVAFSQGPTSVCRVLRA